MQKQARVGFRLSPQQKRIWRLQQASRSACFKTQCLALIEEELDGRSFTCALNALINRHEILRTVFTRIPGMSVPVQVISETGSAVIDEHDLEGLDSVGQRAHIEHLYQAAIDSELDYEQPAALHVSLIHLGRCRNAVIMSLPAMHCDEGALTSLVNELALEYHSLGTKDLERAEPVQYADVAEVFNTLLESNKARPGREYWRKKTRRAFPDQKLGLEREAGSTERFKPSVIRRQVASHVVRALEEVIPECDTSLSVFLLTCWAVQVWRLSGATKNVIGTLYDGRTFEGSHTAIGLLARYLPTEFELQQGASFLDSVRHVDDLVSDAHQVQSYFNWDSDSRSADNNSQPSFFSLAFDFHQIGRPTAGQALSLSVEQSFSCIDRFNIRVSCKRSGHALSVEFYYETTLYQEHDIRRLSCQFLTLVESAAHNANQGIASICLLDEGQQQQVLVEWHDTGCEYERGLCLHELFSRQAKLAPDAAAVVYEGATLSYGELNRRSNQLAHYLGELGVGPDERVAICLERSLEMMVGLLGVLKAGGAYVPLDPAYPVERLSYMLEESTPLVLLTQGHLRRLLKDVTAAVVVVELGAGTSIWDGYSEDDLDSSTIGLEPEDLTYVIYTSGSTGTPKGVMVEHRSVVNRIVWMQRVYGLNRDDVVLQKTPISFDVSVWELFCPLMCGMRLVVARPDGHRDPGYLWETIERERISTLHFVPSMLEVFVEEEHRCEWSSLERVVCSGEALSGMQVRSFYERARGVELHNLYGPTEAAVDVTAWNCKGEIEGRTVPIGKPMANVGIYILDRYGEAVPIEVAGELYVGGVQVGRGYLKRAELTGERFVPDPFGGDGGGRMYRTGDLGRWRTDGAIEFIGRNDHQVKIRGYRIELSEIEARLAKHVGVRDAVVTAREDTKGEKRLVVYYTAAEENGAGERIGAEELRRHLSAMLPGYMVPGAYVRLERLPLAPNGKLDRKALPVPEGAAYGGRDYEEPVGEIEMTVAEIWAEALKVERVGRRDNFFALGGHSMLAVGIIARLRRVGLEVDVRTLFAKSTVAELAAEIGSRTIVEVPPNGIPLACDAIRPEMLPLVELTAEEIESIVKVVSGGAANVQDIYPLAPLQQGMLFHHVMEGESDPYVLGSFYSFDNRQRVERYVEAMQAVIDRHDILRTGVVWEELSEPVQVVWRKAVLPVEEVPLEVGAGEGTGDTATQLGERYRARLHRMDVRQAPMLRVAIGHDEDKGTWMMLLLQHHLIGDHTTLEVMREEIEAYLLGRGDLLPPALPFRNLVAQARLGTSQEEHEAYFRQLLGDVEEPTAPFGSLNVQGDGTEVAQANMRVETGLGRRIRERARKLGMSAASVCHVAWAQVASRTSGREDVVFGTVLFGRMLGGEGADRAMGLFVNTLPMRMRVGEETAEESVRGAQRQLAELMRHEHASLALAQRCSGVPAPAPLFTSLFNYRHNPRGGPTRSEEKARAWEGIQEFYGVERTNYPLNVSANDLGEGFSVTTLAETSIDARRVCQYMHTALESLVEALERDPSRPLRTLEVVPEGEKRQMLYEWNATEAEYPRDRCVHELLEEQAEKTPEAVAVVFEDAMLSYGELNRRANQLGHYLRELGVGRDERVAICLERSLEMIVGLLSVLKAGGAYVPLDLGCPKERLHYILEDSAPLVLLTQGRWQGVFSGVGEKLAVVEVDEAAPSWDERPAINPQPSSVGLSPEHLAYVIYTSGSTGQPKGVAVTHQNVARLFSATQEVFGFNRDDIWTLFHSYAFDFSVWEMWGALLYGGRVEVVPYLVSRSPREFLEFLESKGVTILNQTPSAFYQLMQADQLDEGRARSLSLRYVIFGGEALDIWRLKDWYDRYGERRPRLVNMYGITETTVHVTHMVLDESSMRSAQSVIGRRIPDLRMYVLDRWGQAAPIGVTGELYVAGAGLARGYLTRAELTGERFVADPYGKAGTRMYKTGDLARCGGDENLEFVGRADQQVKIRGYRIELGEIEARLAEREGVGEVVVMAREDRIGDKRLVAYYTGAEENGGAGEGIGAEELRRHLSVTLPAYMVPAAYVRLEKMPLTANGKLDRKVLPAPEGDAYGARDYEEPVGEIERTVAEIWADVLKVERPGVSQNFFDLGGHSLLLLKVLSKLKEEFDRPVAIVDLFRYPTIRSLSFFLAQINTKAPVLLQQDVVQSVEAGVARQSLRLQLSKSFMGQELRNEQFASSESD
jgi:amino acid adenylation domain-containing protein